MRKTVRSINVISMISGGIIGVELMLLLGRDRNTFSIINSEILTDVWLANSTTTDITLATIRRLTFTVEDIPTRTHKATDAKLLLEFERIETKPTAIALTDWLVFWNMFPPPIKTLRTAKLMAFIACLQIVDFQCSLRERMITLSLSTSVLCPVLSLYVHVMVYSNNSFHSVI